MQRREAPDQAAGLRRLMRPGPVKVLAVTGGKGGVGKTSMAVNLALTLAGSGRHTLLLDADLGLANVDVMLGLSPSANLSQVMRGEMELQDVIVSGPRGLRIIPAASGVSEMANLSLQQQGGLIAAFSSLPWSPEVMVVDTAPGIGRSVTGFCQAAHEVIVVLCDEPSSLTDAYALIKVLSLEHGVRRFQVLCNRVQHEQHGRKLYQMLLSVCDRFLDVSLGYFGSVPEDGALVRAVRRQQAVVEAYPSSKSALAFGRLARAADHWMTPAGGGLGFFFDRAVAAASPTMAGVA